MKKYLSTSIIVLLCHLMQAQSPDIIVSNSQNKILEFNDNCISATNCTNVKGIILPIVTGPTTNLLNNYSDGTFLLDTDEKRIKVKVNSSWMILSFANADLTSVVTPSTAVDVGEGVYIGDNQSSNSTSGVLVLDAVNKALVLPKVYRPYENVKNPYPGMMCYDIDSKSLMLFDGKYWNIWRKKKS